MADIQYDKYSLTFSQASTRGTLEAFDPEQASTIDAGYATGKIRFKNQIDSKTGARTGYVTSVDIPRAETVTRENYTISLRKYSELKGYLEKYFAKEINAGISAGKLSLNDDVASYVGGAHQMLNDQDPDNDSQAYDIMSQILNQLGSLFDDSSSVMPQEYKNRYKMYEALSALDEKMNSIQERQKTNFVEDEGSDKKEDGEIKYDFSYDLGGAECLTEDDLKKCTIEVPSGAIQNTLTSLSGFEKGSVTFSKEVIKGNDGKSYLHTTYDIDLQYGELFTDSDQVMNFIKKIKVDCIDGYIVGIRVFFRDSWDVGVYEPQDKGYVMNQDYGEGGSGLDLLALLQPTLVVQAGTPDFLGDKDIFSGEYIKSLDKQKIFYVAYLIFNAAIQAGINDEEITADSDMAHKHASNFQSLAMQNSDASDFSKVQSNLPLPFMKPLTPAQLGFWRKHFSESGEKVGDSISASDQGSGSQVQKRLDGVLNQVKQSSPEAAEDIKQKLFKEGLIDQNAHVVSGKEAELDNLLTKLTQPAQP